MQPQVSLVGQQIGGSKPSNKGLASFPWHMALVVAALVAYGLVVVWSAVQGNEDYSFTRQLTGVAAGVVAMIIFYKIDYHNLANFGMALLIVNVVLILSPHLPVIGVNSNGAASWIKIGITIQPGEFAKLTVILFDASIMARYEGCLDDPREYIKAMLLMAVPFVCILTQPDLGTGLVYLCIEAVVLVIGGAKPKYLILTVVALVIVVIAALGVDELIKSSTGEYKLLKQYQRNRLLVFMNEDYDPDGDGYNLRQAKIAVGSGGLLGKGLGNATQSSLGYLPESPTDFIFCVLAEQFGFVGAMVLLGLYLALITICVRIARRSNDLFGMLIVASVIGMWLFQILENIGMDIGLMPITGIPLPFMSYGSSFMLSNFILLGMISSVHAHSS